MIDYDYANLAGYIEWMNGLVVRLHTEPDKTRMILQEMQEAADSIGNEAAGLSIAMVRKEVEAIKRSGSPSKAFLELGGKP